MSRIIADKGRQRLEAFSGVGFFYVFEMDCGCEIHVNEITMLSGSRASGVDLRDRLGRVASAHDCDVVVHHAPEGRRREIRQRAQRESPIMYMGLDISSEWMRAWDPPSRPERWRSGPAPALRAPEQEVRRATEQLQVMQANAGIVDEIIRAAPKTAQVEPLKKSEDQPKDRFELIELD